MLVFKHHGSQYLYNGDIIITFLGYVYDRMLTFHRKVIVIPVDYVTTPDRMINMRGDVRLCHECSQCPSSQYCLLYGNLKSEPDIIPVINELLY